MAMALTVRFKAPSIIRQTEASRNSNRVMIALWRVYGKRIAANIRIEG
jgi:hypothetical protein